MTANAPVNILLVDDRPENLLSLEAILSELGETLVRAGSGAEALRRLLEADFAVVVLDVQMPGMSGFEVAQLIRARDRSRLTPIIFLSAFERTEFSVREAYALGAVDYLVKPIESEILRAKVAFFVDYFRKARDLREAERRVAEAALREKDERLNLLIENIKDYAFVLTDPAGVVQEWQGGAERITGFAAREAEGQRVRLLFTPQDRAAGVPEEELRKAAAQGRAEDRRWHLRRDGSLFFADGVTIALYDGDGRLRGFGKVFKDATGEERAEEARRRHTEQLRALADVASRLNAVLDLGAVLRVVTEEGRALIGAEQAVADVAPPGAAPLRVAAYAEGLLAQSPGLDAPDRSAIFDRIFADNRPVRLSHAMLQARSDWDALREAAELPPPLRGLLAAPLVGRSGERLGVLQLSDKGGGEFTEEDEAILVQLAQMAAVAVENTQLYQALRDADRRKDEFLAMLAHELRNPLAPIRSALTLLERTGSREEPAVRLRDMISRQVTHLTRLVDDLMDVARITSGKVALQKEPVELAALVAQAAEASRPLVESRGHTLTIDVAPDPVWLDADRVRLAQVVSNLLNNAAKYTDEGGRIRLSARREGEEAVLRVRDTGVGLSSEEIGRVFDLFTQASGGLARTAGGLGVGLTLARELVEMHGGTVSAASEGPGKGCEFTVRLPAAAPIEGPRAAPGEGEYGEPRRVLVVDDNPDALESLSLLLETYGHEVRTAGDGIAAVEVARAFRPEVMLLDLGLPGRDGYEVARLLRAEFPPAALRLVALSGYGQPEDRRRSRDAGFDEHLVKPVDLDVLERALRGGAG